MEVLERGEGGARIDLVLTDTLMPEVRRGRGAAAAFRDDDGRVSEVNSRTTSSVTAKVSVRGELAAPRSDRQSRRRSPTPKCLTRSGARALDSPPFFTKPHNESARQ